MDITVSLKGRVAIVGLAGKLDLASAGRLKERVQSLLEERRCLIHLNMKEVDFINSSGLGALVSLMKEIRMHKGRLTISDMAPYVDEIFEITQLSHVFEIFPTCEEAMTSYGTLAAV
ncbi:MAG: STAS domain-containing protein [candidate division Zixibacteria bacterium]|nr:STAS domain-containing protein [candidate division Zixibacteria bacterium]